MGPQAMTVGWHGMAGEKNPPEVRCQRLPSDAAHYKSAAPHGFLRDCCAPNRQGSLGVSVRSDPFVIAGKSRLTANKTLPRCKRTSVATHSCTTRWNGISTKHQKSRMFPLLWFPFVPGHILPNHAGHVSRGSSEARTKWAGHRQQQAQERHLHSRKLDTVASYIRGAPRSLLHSFCMSQRARPRPNWNDGCRENRFQRTLCRRRG